MAEQRLQPEIARYRAILIGREGQNHYALQNKQMYRITIACRKLPVACESGADWLADMGLRFI